MEVTILSVDRRLSPKSTSVGKIIENDQMEEDTRPKEDYTNTLS